MPLILGLVLWVGARETALPEHRGQPLPKALSPQSRATLELPPTLASGWKLQGRAERFNDKTLFDRIDGAAPTYIQAGFRQSVGAEYRKQGVTDPVAVDLYDMGTAARALGIYAAERDKSYTFIEMGSEGYLASGSLNLWMGRFYLKLAGYAEGETMDRALKEVAQGLIAALPRDPQAEKALAPLTLLPRENRIPHADGYSHPPLGDVEGLQQVFYADYAQQAQVYRLFVAAPTTREEAEGRYLKAKTYTHHHFSPAQEHLEGDLRLFHARRETAEIILGWRDRMLLGAMSVAEGTLGPGIKTTLLYVLQKGLPPAREE
jgi:hypothetical protein